MRAAVFMVVGALAAAIAVIVVVTVGGSRETAPEPGAGDLAAAPTLEDTAGTTVPPTTATEESTTTASPEPATPTTTRAADTPPRTSTSSTPTPVAAGQPNDPPQVSIVAPGSLTRHAATYDPASGRFVAAVAMSALVSDPNGDAVSIDWYSDIDGFLGSGPDVTALLQPQGDASQPVITVVVTDATGAMAQASISVIVWIPSDQ